MAARRRKVLWSDAAAEDLWSVVEHIARDRPQTAVDILHEARRQAQMLHSAPDRGRIVPELARHGIRDYRELTFSVWRLIYRVIPDAVQVVSMIDSRRHVEDVLLRRLTRGP